jgi:transcriptional regulator with XRE-family HTH domain
MSESADITALGAELRDARQKRDLTLQDVERRLHIRQKFLEALEGGQVDLLPSPPQTRGFLRNYARFLGMDAELMAVRWDQALSKELSSRRGRARRTGSAPVAPPQDDPRASQTARLISPSRTMPIPPSLSTGAEPEAPARSRPRIGPLLFLAALIVLLVVALTSGGQWVQQFLASEGDRQGDSVLSPRLGTAGTLTGTPLSETLVDVTEATPEPARPTSLPNPNVPPGGEIVQATPPTLLAPAVEGEGDVSMQLEVVARTWLRVTVDGEVSYQGAPGPNTILQYRGNTIAIRASNGAGLHAIINNRDLGILGARGQIVDQTFTAGTLEQLVPTATAAPELASTVTPTAELTLELTAEPTATTSP